MRKKQYSGKLKYVICITFILVFGLIGSSYAMWSESHFVINKFNTGYLAANIEVDLPDSEFIVVTEKIIITNNNDKENNNQGYDNQSITKDYHFNYNEIPFSIVNHGTVPLKLDKHEIFLNSINISDICSIAYDESVIVDSYRGYIQIDSKRVEELAGFINNENSNIVLTFFFKQSNLIDGGWTQEVSIFIPISKESETIIINNDNEDNNSENENNDEDDNDNQGENENNDKDEDDNNNQDKNENNYEDEDDNQSEKNSDNNMVEDNNSKNCNDIENNNIESNTTEYIDGGDGNES